MKRLRDRIVRLERVPADRLLPAPRNWRVHPARQRDAWRQVVSEIGFAGAVLARQRDDGRLELIDGHLRASELGAAKIPVLVCDLTADEARRALLAHDALAELAEVDVDQLAHLLAETSALPPALDAYFAEATQDADRCAGDAARSIDDSWQLPAAYDVVVECGSEAEQRDLFQQLTREGWTCRLLTL
jgi:ParB-like chromosome segregation protein Spo0J